MICVSVRSAKPFFLLFSFGIFLVETQLSQHAVVVPPSLINRCREKLYFGTYHVDNITIIIRRGTARSVCRQDNTHVNNVIHSDFFLFPINLYIESNP